MDTIGLEVRSRIKFHLLAISTKVIQISTESLGLNDQFKIASRKAFHGNGTARRVQDAELNAISARRPHQEVRLPGAEGGRTQKCPRAFLSSKHHIASFAAESCFRFHQCIFVSGSRNFGFVEA